MPNLVLSKRTFMLFSTSINDVSPIGTAFGIAKPGLVLTADHVVGNHPPQSLVLACTYYSPLYMASVQRIERHPDADVAALFVGEKDAERLEHFEIGVPSDMYSGYADYPLAEEVLAYGFPMMGNEKPIPPRMMKGHIQARYAYTSPPRYRYHAYELAFPAFPGLSGSPVFCDLTNRNAAVAVVTSSIAYSSQIGEDTTKADWAIGASLPPLVDWLQSL